MFRYFVKSALLLGISVVILCGVYPGVLWLIGHLRQNASRELIACTC
jgi:hypothetical protein